jgi:hypothetical protein
MLYRDDPAGTIAIGQPAHAWLSGQLARAWGNAQFGAFAPWGEVCLAAEQHDIGMAAWEGAPTLNRRTGRAHSFMDLPEPLHSQMFAAASRLLLAQNRYAALLTSLHFTGLAERHDGTNDPPEAAQAIRDYLADERAWQARVAGALRADPYYAPHAAPEVVDRNRRLVAAWDWLSLLLLMGLRRVAEVTVPDAEGATALTLTPAPGDMARVTVHPWPFARDTLTLICEGRRLAATYDDEEALRAALADAPWVTLQIALTPG